MARYDYRCTSCGNVFEVEHGMTEHPEITCPTCGASAEKVLGQRVLQHRPARRGLLDRSDKRLG